MADDRIRARGLLGAAGLAIGYLAVSTLLLWGTAGVVAAVRAPGPAPVDGELGVVAAAGAWAVLSWLTAVTLGALLTAAVAGLGSRAHQRALAMAPNAARRLVGGLLGLTVVTLPVAAGLPAGAAQRPAAVVTGDLPGTSNRPDPVAAATSGPFPSAVAAWSGDGPGRIPASLDRPAAGPPAGWTPDRPVAPRHRSDGAPAVRLVSTAPRAGRVVSDELVVRRGDTLWEIAARHLGSNASAADIAVEWPRWYAANRDVIGADPDLLLPGQRLVPPRR